MQGRDCAMLRILVGGGSEGAVLPSGAAAGLGHPWSKLDHLSRGAGEGAMGSSLEWLWWALALWHMALDTRPTGPCHPEAKMG